MARGDAERLCFWPHPGDKPPVCTEKRVPRRAVSLGASLCLQDARPWGASV